ncbi:MAG: hypothetical protein GX772_11300 [Alcaligenaceae bacterium]|nr:hypothetical protein [Alcaligenaceae bacterium]
MLNVNPEIAAQSVDELLALAKQQPGKLNFGSVGTGINRTRHCQCIGNIAPLLRQALIVLKAQ